MKRKTIHLHEGIHQLSNAADECRLLVDEKTPTALDGEDEICERMGHLATMQRPERQTRLRSSKSSFGICNSKLSWPFQEAGNVHDIRYVDI